MQIASHICKRLVLKTLQIELNMGNNDKESTRYEKLLELNICNNDKESTRYEKLLEEELTVR